MDNKFRILLVDDEKDFLEPIAFWLESKGYSVTMALNGQEALELVEQEVPNIILLDINMPVMDGLETLKKVREKHQDLPIIMITAESEKIYSTQDLEVSGFFPKGGTLRQLEELLEPILRLHAKIKSS